MPTISVPARSPWPRIAIAVGITLTIGLLAGLSMSGSWYGWYAQLQKPSFAPPTWVFGPVWTLLYVLMGIGAGLVWRAGTEQAGVRRALGLYTVQLILNAMWSFIFFGLREMGWALVDMAVLWCLIIATMFAFARVQRAAAWLLLPYICWVSFAFLLNAAFVRLN